MTRTLAAAILLVAGCADDASDLRVSASTSLVSSSSSTGSPPSTIATASVSTTSHPGGCHDEFKGESGHPVSMDTPEILGAADLDGDGDLDVFVANDGNTARSGGVWRRDGCVLQRVVGVDGLPFTYIYEATGRGCAPACYPSVECQRSGSLIALVVSEADAVRASPGAEPSPLSDDLPYRWRVRRFRLEGNAMVAITADEGTARHRDLPVPKEQGFRCLT
jgi:hypothetical protein